MFLFKRIVKVDHSPRHYANTQPIRYAPTPRVGMCNYAPCADYDYYGHDRSYSTSFSTSELFQPQPYMSTYAPPPSNYQMSQGYAGGVSASSMQQGQAAPQYSQAGSGATYGYGYGYRPGAAAAPSYPNQPGPANYRNYWKKKD